MRSPSARARDPPVMAPGKLIVVHEREHGLAWLAEHCDGEAHRDVLAVVAVLIVDDIAARLPERPASPDDTRWLTLELEHHLALQHIPEARPGVPMRRVARMARRELDNDGHCVRARRDERRLHLLHDGNKRLQLIQARLLPGTRGLRLRHGITPVDHAYRGRLPCQDRPPARVVTPSGSTLRAIVGHGRPHTLDVADSPLDDRYPCDVLHVATARRMTTGTGIEPPWPACLSAVLALKSCRTERVSHRRPSMTEASLEQNITAA